MESLSVMSGYVGNGRNFTPLSVRNMLDTDVQWCYIALYAGFYAVSSRYSPVY